MSGLKLDTKHVYASGGGWSRWAMVDSVAYIVGVERGNPARIAFKPRGKNRGYHWWGFVRRPVDGKRVWEGRVGKSIGARGLLKAAGVIRSEP